MPVARTMSCTVGPMATPAPQPCGVVISSVGSASAECTGTTLSSVKVTNGNSENVPAIIRTSCTAMLTLRMVAPNGRLVQIK